jgi:hypothetical protein
MLLKAVKLNPIFFTLSLFLVPNWSHATLGEIENSVEADKVLLKGTRILLKYPKFSVHNIIAASGNQIKEYVTLEGRVFALTWNGLSHPDLSSLLGSYFKEYEDKRIGRGQLRGRKIQAVQTNRVVVMKSGHMRDVKGSAFVPQLVPAGVTIEELN